MSTDRLENLFEEIGKAAEAAARLRGATGPGPGGGNVAPTAVVAQSELVQTVRDLRRQLEAARLGTVSPSASEPSARRKAAPSQAPSEGTATGPRGMNLAQATLEFIRRQEQAGKAVGAFTAALARAASFVYGFTTGRVITPSGRTLPLRRALAIRLRDVPGAGPIRRLLQAPDRLLRPLSRDLSRIYDIAQGRAGGRRAPAPSAPAAGRASAAAAGPVSAAAGGAAVAASRLPAASAAGGAAVAGGRSLAAAAAALSTLGAAAGITAGVVGAIATFVLSLRLATTAVRGFGERLARTQFERLSGYSPQHAYAQARLQAYEIGSRIREGRATGPSSILLTEALISLRTEMGPINRLLARYANLFAYSLVQIARGLNALLRLADPAIKALEEVASLLERMLGSDGDQLNIPTEELLRRLQQMGPFNPRPPRGDFPP